jgi:hypothetical protein
MVIDKFGRSTSRKQSGQTSGFVLTENGDFDVKRKRICNLHKPSHINDATNKLYVDDKITQELNSIKNEFRPKILHSTNIIKQLEIKFLEQANIVKNLEKKLSELDVQFPKAKLDKSVIIALPRKQNTQTTTNSEQLSNTTITNTTSLSPSAPKKMKIQ